MVYHRNNLQTFVRGALHESICPACCAWAGRLPDRLRPKTPDTLRQPATAELPPPPPRLRLTQPAAAEPAAAVGTVLPAGADAGRSYLDETLFIGDSNTARYLLYADDTGTALQAFPTTSVLSAWARARSPR